MLVFVYAFSLGSSVELSRKRESNPYPSPLEEGGEMRLLCRLSYLGMCFCNDGGQYKHKVSLSQETYLMLNKKKAELLLGFYILANVLVSIPSFQVLLWFYRVFHLH